MLSVKQDLNQAKYYLKITTQDELLMWGWMPILCLFDYICRWLAGNRLYETQSFCMVIGLLLVCMISYLSYQQFRLFQLNEIDTVKMLGMSNLSIFFIAGYQTRYLYMLVMCIFGILNIFIVSTPILTLLILEFCIYWYIFIFMYYLKTWHFYRMKLGKFFYRIKKIVNCVLLLAVLLVFLFQRQLQVILRVKKACAGFQVWYMQLVELANNILGVAMIWVFMIGTMFWYFRFIYAHSLWEEDENAVNVYTSSKTIQDVILRFRGNKILQTIKLNYILFNRNFGCFFCKLLIGAFWFLIVFYCKDSKLCYYAGTTIISMVGSLIFYRVRDDKYNWELYQSIGCTMNKMFFHHCICAFFYLHDVVVLGMIIGLLKGNLTVVQVCFLILCMAYKTVFFASFNFYFMMIREVSADSQLYEAFACFGGIFISLTPFSILVPILYWFKVRKIEED